MNGRARGQRPVNRALGTCFSGFSFSAGRFNALLLPRCRAANP
jgi:hypothetical protein